ncbi:RNA-binding protein lsm5 [Ascosphaera pollenicola]|nr:RNA-binding protein lsm5 [Ascosphaera pollenicola]
MLSRLHRIPSFPRGSSSPCYPHSRAYHRISYYNNNINSRRRRTHITLEARTRISKRRFSSKCSHSAKPKSGPAPLKPPPLRPTPLRPTPLRPPPLSASPPPLRPGVPGATAPIPPRRIRRRSSIEDSVAHLFAPELVQEAQVKKFENAIEQVAREARAREEERYRIIKMLRDTYNEINGKALPALTRELKSIRDQVREIEKNAAQREDQVVSQSIMERLKSFIREQRGQQQEAIVQTIEQMPGYLEKPTDAAEESRQKEKRKEILDPSLMTAPVEEAIAPAESVGAQIKGQDAVSAELRERRAEIKHQLHIIDLEAMFAEHAHDILMINSSVLKIEMKMREIENEQKRKQEVAQQEEERAVLALVEKRQRALADFLAAKNAIPTKIEQRSEVYRTYQDLSKEWAGSMDEVLYALGDAIKVFSSYAEALRTSRDVLASLKGEITQACHDHRKYLRHCLKLTPEYCVDPTAWSIESVGRRGIDMLMNTRDALDPPPKGLRSFLPTKLLETLPKGSPEKAQVKLRLRNMASLVYETDEFKRELSTYRVLLRTIEQRKFREALQEDKLRLIQLEMTWPFMVVRAQIMTTMATARWMAFRRGFVSGDMKPIESSSRWQQAKELEKVREGSQPFLRFFYKSRDTLEDFSTMYDEWVELSWARLQLEEKFPELVKMALNQVLHSEFTTLSRKEQRKQLQLERLLQSSFRSLKDQEYRDRIFTSWANSLHLIGSASLPSDTSPDYYLTGKELRKKKTKQAVAGITSAAPYRLQQEAAQAAAQAAAKASTDLSSAVAPEEVARTQNATRARLSNGDTNGMNPTRTSSSVHMLFTKNVPDGNGAVVTQTTTTSHLSSTVSASSVLGTAAAGNTGGFMSARRSGFAFGEPVFEPSSSSPPPPPPPSQSRLPVQADEPSKYFSYRNYQSSAGKPIKLHICLSLSQSESICSLMLSELNSNLVNGVEPVIGFDMEWKMNATVKSRMTDSVSVIQLATPNRVAILHLARFPKQRSPADLLAPSLRVIMEDPSIVKCGVNIKSDCTRFTRVLGAVPQNIYEISLLYRLVKYPADDAEATSRRPVQLARQVEEILGVPLDKSEDARCGNWAQRLSLKQLEYAASDAYANLKLFQALESHRELMVNSPDRPSMIPSPSPPNKASKKQSSAPASPISKITKAGKRKEPTKPAKPANSANSANSAKVTIAAETPSTESITVIPESPLKKTSHSKTVSENVSRAPSNDGSDKENVAASDGEVPEAQPVLFTRWVSALTRWPLSSQSESPPKEESPDKQPPKQVVQKDNVSNVDDAYSSSSSSSGFDSGRSVSQVRKASSWRKIRVVSSVKRPYVGSRPKSRESQVP